MQPLAPPLLSMNFHALTAPTHSTGNRRAALALAALGIALLAAPSASASIAYGSINNFDTVNDTGTICHGFEIEIEDCHSTDITYTFDYNHYGTPRISEDLTDPAHPRTRIRWESRKNPDGSWAAYTAVPTGPIAPTDGHAFTNPSINFGGEHFGCGYSLAVGLIRYNWLVDDGAGNLVHGGPVQVSTPVFTYYPPVAVAAPAQVVAVIPAPPEPPEIPVKEFGQPLWVKEIRTQTHNNKPIHLRDLLTDDPDDPDDKNWTNGEPDEVEMEFFLLQRDLTKADGGNNARLEANPEDLDHGDEIITRRYEFFTYTGPIDEETGEALAGSVGPDGIHGVGVREVNGVEVDLAEVVVVGDYKGAQMAAVDVDAGVALIDHVSTATESEPYAARKLVVNAGLPFEATAEGALPAGMAFDAATGVLSGTPAETGTFAFRVTATDTLNPPVTKDYTLVVDAAAVPPPAIKMLDLAVEPAGCGGAVGGGAYNHGDAPVVSAVADLDYRFVHWTDNGKVVSTQREFPAELLVNRSLVAHFAPMPRLKMQRTARASTLGKLEWQDDLGGLVLEESTTLEPTSWTPSARAVTTAPGGVNQVDLSGAPSVIFFRLAQP